MAVAVVISAVVGLAPLLLLLLVYMYSRSLVLPGVAPGQFWQLPVFGESFSLLFGAKNDEFLNSHVSRYGRVFRSVLFGAPTISVTSKETVKFVLGNPDLFKSSFTPSFMILLFGRGDGWNPESIPLQALHLALLRKSVTIDKIKIFLPTINKLARKLMDSWEGRSHINTLDEMSKFTFMIASTLTHDSLSKLDSKEVDKLRQAFSTIGRALFSFKIDCPGTLFHKGLIARKYILSVFRRFVEERREEKGPTAHNDLTQSLLESHGDISTAFLAQTLLSSTFAALETSAIVLTWFILDLMVYPDVFEAVYEENQKLAELREARPYDSVTFADITERLQVTNRALQESLRFRSPVLFTIREATQDVLHKGILYPKGWKVFTWFRALHLDPQNFDSPYVYNLSRFQNTPIPNSYVPFGNGPHSCPGKELFRAEALVFVHFFITSFKIRPQNKIDPKDLKIKFWPVACPEDGVPLTISPRP